MRSHYTFAVCFSLVTLGGCASDRVAEPAATLSTELSRFQAGLSGFQDELNSDQTDDKVRISGEAARRDVATAMTRQLSTEWSIARAQDENQILSVLQAQAREETDRQMNAAPSTFPAPVSLPIQALGGIASAVGKLSQKPGMKADLEFLLNYGIAVNKQLAKIEQAAATKPQTDSSKH